MHNHSLQYCGTSLHYWIVKYELMSLSYMYCKYVDNSFLTSIRLWKLYQGEANYNVWITKSCVQYQTTHNKSNMLEPQTNKNKKSKHSGDSYSSASWKNIMLVMYIEYSECHRPMLTFLSNQKTHQLSHFNMCKGKKKKKMGVFITKVTNLTILHSLNLIG